MAVKCKLSTLMGVNRYNIQDVFEKTGLARSTIATLYHDKAKRVDYETVNKLCTLFCCKIEDLLDFTNDE